MTWVLPRRLELFEFHEQPWVPDVLREGVVEALGLTTKWGDLLHGLAAPFLDFLRETEADSVLELCSGSGQMAALWLAELKRRGERAPRFVLSDLSPRVQLWESLRRVHPEIEFIETRVDATAVARQLDGSRPRLIANALHHFAPEQVRALFSDALRRSPGVFVCENFPRNPLATLGPGKYGLPAVLANPWLCRERKLGKLLFTWGLPVIPLMFFWDGLVSSLRMHTEQELRALLPSWEAIRVVSGSFGRGGLQQGMYFYATRTGGGGP